MRIPFSATLHWPQPTPPARRIGNGYDAVIDVLQMTLDQPRHQAVLSDRQSPGVNVYFEAYNSAEHADKALKAGLESATLLERIHLKDPTLPDTRQIRLLKRLAPWLPQRLTKMNATRLASLKALQADAFVAAHLDKNEQNRLHVGISKRHTVLSVGNYRLSDLARVDQFDALAKNLCDLVSRLRGGGD